MSGNIVSKVVPGIVFVGFIYGLVHAIVGFYCMRHAHKASKDIGIPETEMHRLKKAATKHLFMALGILAAACVIYFLGQFFGLCGVPK